MKIKFENPNIRNKKENKSKLLDNNSELYKFIKTIKFDLCKNNLNHTDRIDLHIEVLNNNDEKLENFLNRVKELEDFDVDIKNKINYGIIGNAVVLFVKTPSGYNRKAHITIAYYNNKNDTKKAFDFIISNYL